MEEILNELELEEGDDSKEEIITGYEILKSLNLRTKGTTLVACPSCGRADINVTKLANMVDEALKLVDKNIKVQDIIELITSIDKNLIKSVKVFDVYEGNNIPANKKSIALNVTIQSFEKTLNDSDLEKINNLIISTVESKSGAKIRS